MSSNLTQKFVSLSCMCDLKSAMLMSPRLTKRPNERQQLRLVRIQNQQNVQPITFLAPPPIYKCCIWALLQMDAQNKSIGFPEVLHLACPAKNTTITANYLNL